MNAVLRRVLREDFRDRSLYEELVRGSVQLVRHGRLQTRDVLRRNVALGDVVLADANGFRARFVDDDHHVVGCLRERRRDGHGGQHDPKANDCSRGGTTGHARECTMIGLR